MIDRRRAQVSDAVRERVEMSFRIVDRIHVILTDKGLGAERPCRDAWKERI